MAINENSATNKVMRRLIIYFTQS